MSKTLRFFLLEFCFCLFLEYSQVIYGFVCGLISSNWFNLIYGPSLACISQWIFSYVIQHLLQRLGNDNSHAAQIQLVFICKIRNGSICSNWHLLASRSMRLQLCHRHLMFSRPVHAASALFVCVCVFCKKYDWVSRMNEWCIPVV